MPADKLDYTGWSKHGTIIPEPEVRDTILEICPFTAQIEHVGTRDSIILYPNLATAMENHSIVTKDLF